MMHERRKLPRWQINQQGALKLEQGQQDVVLPPLAKATGEQDVVLPPLAKATQELFCQVKDISYRGAKITLDTKLPEDAALRISLQLSEDYTIDAEVWVAWHKVIDGSNHYGLYFSRIKDADKEKIFKFIRKFYPDDLKQRYWLGLAETEREKGGEDMVDHRIFERFKKEFSARFISVDGKEGLGQTFDVSAKGLSLSTSHELESRTALEIWLDVPNSVDPLYTRGQVVWSRLGGKAGFRSGIELERADLMGISRLLRA